MLFDKVKFVAMVVGFLCLAYLAVVGAVTVVTGAPPAWAGPLGASPIAPGYISYQGTLRDADDNPISGTYNMEVQIYDAASGGSLLWSETHIGVAVQEGHFRLLLGEETAFEWTDFNSPDRYIGLTVDGDEMTERQRFTTVPYAIFAKALSAPDGDPMTAVTVDDDGNVGIGPTTPDRPLTIQGSGPASEWISFKDDASGETQWHLNYHGTGLNFVESGVASARLFLKDGGNVGIGTANPQAKLDVNGSARVVGDASVTGRVGIGTTPLGNKPLTIQGDGNFSEWIQFLDTGGTTQWHLNYNQYYPGKTGLNFVESGVVPGGSARLFLKDGGNVGIGTDNPQAKLDVDGDIDWSGDLRGFAYRGPTGGAQFGEGLLKWDLDVAPDEGICFLSRVGFTNIGDYWDDEHAICQIVVNSQGNWELQAVADGDGVASCHARCLTW